MKRKMKEYDELKKIAKDKAINIKMWTIIKYKKIYPCLRVIFQTNWRRYKILYAKNSTTENK